MDSFLRPNNSYPSNANVLFSLLRSRQTHQRPIKIPDGVEDHERLIKRTEAMRGIV